MKNELLSITKKSGLVFSGRIVGLVLGSISTFVVARFMGADVLGKFMYLLAFLSFFEIIVRLGLEKGLVSFIPRLKEQGKTEGVKSIVSFALIITTTGALIFSSLLFFKSQFIAENVLNNPALSEVLTLMAPLLFFLVFFKISKGIFRGNNTIKYHVIGNNFISSITKILAVMIFAFIFSYKLVGLILSVYVSFIFTSIYLFTKIIKVNGLSRLDLKYKDTYKNILKFSLPLLFSGFLNFFISKTDTFMIGYFLSEDKVGIYNIAFRIGSLSSFILVAFNNMFAPVISSLYHKDKLSKIESLYKVITKWILGINLIAFSEIILFSDELMHIFGKEFIYGSTALILISVGQVIRAGVGSAGNINIMTDHPQQELYTNIISVIVNLVLNYFLIKSFGINGAAIASLISVSVSNFTRLGFLYKNFRIHPYNLKYIKVIVSIIISSSIVVVLKYLLNWYWVQNLIVFTPILITGFITTYVLLGISKEDKFIIEKFFNFVKGFSRGD